MTELTDAQLLRYSRHILLPQVDVAGQLAICQSRALVAGVGGLGSAAALYLAAAGVGELVVVDDDHVELANLQRQIMHTEARLSHAKTASARAAIHALNSDVQVVCHATRLSESNVTELLAGADVVLDCSDNFATRKLLNKACWERGIALVSGAAIRLEGQLTVFDPHNDASPCYQCLFDISAEEALSCAESGVLGPVVGVIGAAQALEALKLLAGFGEPLVGRVQLYDAARAQFRELKLKRDPNCPVCARRD